MHSSFVKVFVLLQSSSRVLVVDTAAPSGSDSDDHHLLVWVKRCRGVTELVAAMECVCVHLFIFPLLPVKYLPGFWREM